MLAPKSGFSYDGAVKPRRDVGNLCHRHGWNVNLITMFGAMEDNEIENTVSQFRANDIVLVQTPLYTNNPNAEREWLEALQRRDVRVIALVHDADVIRFGGNLENYQELLNQYDCLILPSDKMFEKLGLDWDNNLAFFHTPWYYEVNPIPRSKPLMAQGDKVDIELIYAGNITRVKASFLWNIKTPVLTYGQDDDNAQYLSMVNYGGPIPPEELPAKMPLGFGLVWDGDVIPDLSNNYTSYAQYNMSYKLSAYLAGGLPVIVWENSIFADMVKEKGIGYVVSDLTNIDQLLANTTVTEFQKMYRNVRWLSEDIISGESFYNSIDYATQVFM